MIKDETWPIKTFGADFQAKFNRAIDYAVVQVYGESLLYNGRFREAVPFLEKELKVKRRRGDDEGSIAATYLQLDSASDSLGDHAAALRYYEEELCHSTGDVNVAVTYGNMGNVEESPDNFQKALEYHENALEIRIKTCGIQNVTCATAHANIG